MKFFSAFFASLRLNGRCLPSELPMGSCCPLTRGGSGLILIQLLLLCTRPALSAAPAAVPEIAQANTAFATDLYQREQTKAGNLFFSPYSISTALAMTYAGARGQTATEMAQVLHFTLPQAQVPGAFASLTERMNEVAKTKQATLDIANSIWCQKNFPFTDAFLKLTRDSFGAEARSVDFVSNTEGARQEINSWIARKTQDKIQDLLQRGQLSLDTRLVLCDAVYFKGTWRSRFDPKATRPAPFFTAPSQQVQTPLMFQNLRLRSRQFDNFSLFSLPYGAAAGTNQPSVSMVVLLPRAVDGLAALEAQINAANLRQWLAGVDTAPEVKSELYLPRFKLNCRLDLAKDLAAMGMPTAFSSSADFSGMNGDRNLNISQVVHQAFVDVNEEGTEAAAATAVGVALTAARLPNPVFRVDHPFIFLIRESQTGSLLFLGRVVDPTK
jgi:serine protease inhibitor